MKLKFKLLPLSIAAITLSLGAISTAQAWCASTGALNFVCRDAGHGAGVLIRALEPSHGLDWMRAPRAGPRCCVRATDTRLH